jgi:hypothetical protein
MLLLFGIPVFVWMKWRESERRWIEDAAFSLRRAHTPPPRPPARPKVPISLHRDS